MAFDLAYEKGARFKVLTGTQEGVVRPCGKYIVTRARGGSCGRDAIRGRGRGRSAIGFTGVYVCRRGACTPGALTAALSPAYSERGKNGKGAVRMYFSVVVGVCVAAYSISHVSNGCEFCSVVGRSGGAAVSWCARGADDGRSDEMYSTLGAAAARWEEQHAAGPRSLLSFGGAGTIARCDDSVLPCGWWHMPEAEKDRFGLASLDTYGA